ncbi:trifunctional transcriptional regulator/proline dehydrogenase/L-glutamate gamma-semialdehyde dehydrogenase [Brenneria alni]|uniref:Bifunctional protein PutA n=1 Tax=Brenneria alni TaxID=71656 RepID=A0A421DLY8_9GAMM|nr:trifunctional transcriptional regulator/proline dehydrogenase/L-glutamate gamma-semialdehyde dehydrogenase [Brenneria alni]RLM21557.1 trifunctional transcriptional regulator/proline dehydrogenase/L-glutamate gamma-semialdehyde dehydrogenase [Brenneria alni]
MGTTALGVKLDEATSDRIKAAARRLDRTPYWLIKQAIFSYLERLESGTDTPEIPQPAVSSQTEAEEIMPQSQQEETYQPFLVFAEQVIPQSVIRAAITSAYRRPETEMVPKLLEKARLCGELSQSIDKMANRIAERLRAGKGANGEAGMVQGLLQEFSLSSQEGVALMCLAEALLRIPDTPTRDALIRDKIGAGHWHAHIGHSPSLFVNAATWGLLLTGKLVAAQVVDKNHKVGLSGSLSRIIGRGGEPLIRKGVDMAMRLMGEQFVTGETIAQALTNARKREEQGFRHSYDMLGEAALTENDAAAYLEAYQQAIDAIGKASNGRGIYEGPGISIKLSALHPRYGRAQHERVMEELYPRLLSLTLQARHYDIGINIDAEEADRLEISLDLLEKLCFESQLSGWNGIGFVIQAYQKRCPLVIDAVIEIAQRSQRRLMIRLVKGAYWDSEIKRAQVEGLEGYPVYTRKVYTDVSYLACARKLLAAPTFIYPQFATHNAHTLSAIYYLAGNNYYPGQYEFQCLHGMGEPLYEQVVGKVADGKLNRPCRIYAPVGTHETLLAYLVRRLLENGANTSFVNRIADTSLPLDKLVADPVSEVDALAAMEGRIGLPHPRIPLPRHLYGDSRRNSRGLDLSNEHHLASLSNALLNGATSLWLAAPVMEAESEANEAKPVINPAESRDIVGYVREASEPDVGRAVEAAVRAAAGWRATLPAERAAVLNKAASLMERQLPSLLGLLVREAGKTFGNAIAEVREAVDFLRYYASQAHEFTHDAHRPLGPVVCISPWNFPLAIFTGQVSAALAAGNSVLAKPAEQTPLIAAQAVGILLEAGIPAGVLQLLPGAGESVGAALVNDSRIRGVMFTGSTEVAGLLQRSIAGRLDSQGHLIPLIAETGGLNAMIVDSSALTEQVVSDVIASAFDSAGQRCSALRLLCVQEDIAEHTLQMLRGAMAEYRMGNPHLLATDIGPLIDAEAKNTVERHILVMRAKGLKVFQAARRLAQQDEQEWARGTFVMPTLIELNSVNELQKEVFGPVLHVVRYQSQNLNNLIDQINAAGYGLTLGIHSRIDETIRRITANVRVGNQYVNRNMVGAVVGVQPFGGEGLSGTGPKAGGPLYLYRLLAHRPEDALSQGLARQDHDLALDTTVRTALLPALYALEKWAITEHHGDLVVLCQRYAELELGGTTRLLPGPTGERNTYTLVPRGRVLCLADNNDDALTQVAAVLAVGGRILWEETAWLRGLYRRLPDVVQARIDFSKDWHNPKAMFDAIIYHGDADNLRNLSKQVAERRGPIISLQGFARGETNILLERLLNERTLSVNTAAAGGNAGLMTLG